MIMLKDKSQECPSNGKWKDKCDVVCVFDAFVRWFLNLDVNDYFEACGLFFPLAKPITMTTSSYCKRSH